MSEKEGWVYCISNQNVRSAKAPMNILLKIGMTERTPQERLAEANRSDTWRPPVNYRIEFAKKVKNALQKEKTIHKLLEQYNERVNSSREFFDISFEKARLYFDLMDGEWLEISVEDPDPKQVTPQKRVRGGGVRSARSSMSAISTSLDRNEILNVSEDTDVVMSPRSNFTTTTTTATIKATNKIIKKSTSVVTTAIKPRILRIEHLSNDEAYNLLDIALELQAVEMKVNGKYYHYNDILNSSLKDKINSKMIFTAILKSADEHDRIISSSNLSILTEKLKKQAPSTFILLEQKITTDTVAATSEKDDFKAILKKNPDKIRRIKNMNIRDLTEPQAKLLIKTAFDLEVVHIELGDTVYNFTQILDLSNEQISNNVFEAYYLELDDGESDYDEDRKLYINSTNIKSIISCLKDSTRRNVVILQKVVSL